MTAPEPEEPDVTDATRRIVAIHDQIAGLHHQLTLATQQALHAEQVYIRGVWAVFQAGQINRWDLLDYYDQLRNWGVQGFSLRWSEVVPLRDRNALLRFARETPRRDDGTWRGDTGWPLPDDAIYPGNNIQVAYALLDANTRAVLVNVTKHFKERLKRNAEAGKVWSSWIAVPCASRADAHDAKRQLIAKYGNPSTGGDRA